VLVVLVFPLTVLVFAISVVFFDVWRHNQQCRAHGLSEILCMRSLPGSEQRFGLRPISANTLWYSATIGMAMLVGRFFMIIPMAISRLA
jgi:K+-transporting ATPase ATPase A chain